MQADGRFRARLVPGTYCVVGPDKARATRSPAARGSYVDPGCMLRHQRTCDAIVEVPTASTVRVTIQEQCFGPCYFGPMPP